MTHATLDEIDERLSNYITYLCAYTDNRRLKKSDRNRIQKALDELSMVCEHIRNYEE